MKKKSRRGRPSASRRASGGRSQKPKKKKAPPKAARARLRRAASKPKRAAGGDRRRLAARKAQQLQKQRQQERARKEREQSAARKQREKAQLQARKQREKAQAEKQREKAQLQARKEREKAQAEKQREKAQLQARKERERADKEREKQKLQEARERESQKKAKEKEKEKQAREREAKKAADKKARDAERVRQKQEREAARAREKAEREAERDRLRDEARRKKEEERAKRDAEREAYRKAKEAEQARLRAEREAARRALEGRVVRATRASRAAAGGRLSTTRVYTPSSIPDQSRTRRTSEGEAAANRFANLQMPKGPPSTEGLQRPIPRTIPPPPPPPPPATIEERYARINERLAQTDDAFRHEYEESLLMSWVYHDSALEGVVYTYDELRMAINPNIAVVPDSSLQTVCDEIRRHKAAIDFVREQAEKKRVPITIDTVKRIYLILHPEEGDLKTVKYRKDIPQHRLYFHEYAAPDKIAYKVRQVFDWLNGPEPKKIKNAVRIAARAHYDLLRVFPFALDSGKVARLFMNLLLMRADCPPALVHSTERQKYYEALRGQLPIIVSMVTEAITNALTSIEKKLDERDTKLRTFG